MTSVIDITTESFNSTVVKSDKPVLLDFWAPWCGPCKKLSPIIAEVAEELGEKAIVGKVNVDEERNLGAMFQIMSIPTVIIFKDGKKVDEFVGVKSKAEIIKKVQSFL